MVFGGFEYYKMFVLMVEINMMLLIDVMFVLFVIFIIIVLLMMYVIWFDLLKVVVSVVCDML